MSNELVASKTWTMSRCCRPVCTTLCHGTWLRWHVIITLSQCLFISEQDPFAIGRNIIALLCALCSALCIVHCALCIVHCALCIVHCALCIVHCALCRVRLQELKSGKTSLKFFSSMPVSLGCPRSRCFHNQFCNYICASFNCSIKLFD